jgi:glycine/D-amino acid oxidase-like deaminating enzyme
MSATSGLAHSAWQRERPAAEVGPPLDAPTEARVVVVGAGLAGLAVAHRLSTLIPPNDILVLEASRVGAGASGRSTGIAGPGVGGPITSLVRTYGPEMARRMFDASLAGIGAMRRLAAAMPAGCELTDTHQLVTASAPVHAGRLRRQADTLRGLGFDVEYLDPTRTAAALGTDRYHGALRYPDVAMVNPWLLCQRLTSTLLAAGVRIAERTPVTAFAGGDPVTLVAGGHEVRAHRVLLAVDGFSPALRLFRQRVAVIRTHVLRTSPLPPETMAESGWDGAGAVIDSRSFFNYFRLTAQRELLFGGGPAMIDSRVRERDIAGIRARLVRELSAVFPAFAAVDITDFWSGVTASTFDRLPIVGPVPGAPGVWYAGAWCGHGLALSALTAEHLAPHLAGPADPLALEEHLPWLRSSAPRMPSGRVGDLLLAGYLRGLGAGDRLAALAPARRRRTSGTIGTSATSGTRATRATRATRVGSPGRSGAGPGRGPVDHRFDVVIVGARVAGSALAARLAGAGLSVAVFDRDSLPGPTLSTHILHSTEDLRREGVYDDLLALGVPPLPDVWVRLDDIELRLHHPDDPGMCARRELLDQVLLDRAVAAGAKTFIGTAVVGLRHDDRGVVEGVRVQRPDGSVGDVSARLVVGADGRNSSVARWAGARQYLTTHSERSLVWRYFQGRHLPPALLWHRVGEHIVSALPTGPEEFVVITQPPEHLQAPIYRAGVEAMVRHVAEVSPAVAELVRGAEPAGPAYRIVRYPCYFRQPYGPGWALVGDAGHSKDATLGHGINDALRNARALAEVLNAHWSDPASLTRGLARWARNRDRAELPNYWYGQDIGRSLPINAMERALLAGIARSPRAVDRLDDVMADRQPADGLLTIGRLVRACAGRISGGESPRQVGGEALALVRLARRRYRAAATWSASAPTPVPAGALPAAPVPVGPTEPGEGGGES